MLTQTVFAQKKKEVAPAQLQNSFEFIFKQVMIKKNQVFNPRLDLPQLFVESLTPLKQFQDAIEPQWGFRPDVFTNAFADLRNEIYIIDEADYYRRNQRCMDDSVAHELTHYVQSKYQKFDLNDESLEWDAIEVQTWFRENFCKF
jgi:hypothetical protein